MPAPCRKCGATKTEPFRRGLRHTLARWLGYELRECARCQRLRLLPKRPEGLASKPPRCVRPNDPNYRDTPYGNAGLDGPDGFSGCPGCGSKRYSRSRRRWLERVTRRPPMVQCEDCACRFPVPQA